MTELTPADATPPRCAKHDRALTVCAECYTPPRDTTDTEALGAQLFSDKLSEWLLDFGVPDAHVNAQKVARSFVRDGWVSPIALATRDAALRAEALREAADALNFDALGFKDDAWTAQDQPVLDALTKTMAWLRERADRAARGGEHV